jgi:regulator of RNase E activity RraA
MMCRRVHAGAASVPRKSTKTDAGSMGEVIEIAGPDRPGQTLYSDEDGIVILRSNRLR